MFTLLYVSPSELYHHAYYSFIINTVICLSKQTGSLLRLHPSLYLFLLFVFIRPCRTVLPLLLHIPLHIISSPWQRKRLQRLLETGQKLHHHHLHLHPILQDKLPILPILILNPILNPIPIQLQIPIPISTLQIPVPKLIPIPTPQMSPKG